MPQDRNAENRLGGEFMIQDRDHMSEAGQAGGEARQGKGRRQAEQSQSDGGQQGGGQDDGGQQGGGRSRRRSKLL